MQESISTTTSADLPAPKLDVASRPLKSSRALTLTAGCCCICEQRDADPVGVSADFEYCTGTDALLVQRCRKCQLVYLDPRPSIDDYPLIYPPDYHAFNFTAEQFGLAYRVRVLLETHRLKRWCRGLPDDARIIDVGCGDGFHLRVLRQFGPPGWHLEGIEPNQRAVDAARASGLTVHHGIIEQLDLESNSYDLALLIMTIEHLNEPSTVLTAIRRILRPGGRLIVVTDNTATIDFRIFRSRHWGGYHGPRHTYLFDPTTLRALLEKVGLEVESMGFALSPVNLVYSLHNLLVDWRAPQWLVNRFTLSSPLSLGVFTAFDALRRAAGGGALLRATAREPMVQPSFAHASESKSSAPRTAKGTQAPVAVIGAGIAGLVAARELQTHGVPVIVFEAGTRVAGLAKSFPDEGGFTNDLGAHFITNRLAAALGVGSQCRDVRRYGESVWLGRRPYSYPLGLATVPRFAASALAARAKLGHRTAPVSAAEWFKAEYGDRLADEVAIPLSEQWSGAPASELAPSVGEKLEGGILHVVKLKLSARLTGRAVAHGYCGEQPEGINVWHVYPEQGVGTLCENLAASLGECVRLESPVDGIMVENDRVVAVRVNGRETEVSSVMSTAPVPVLARLVQGTDAVKHFSRFRYRPMVLVNLRLRGRGLLPEVVLWTPETDYPFFRITEAPLSMPWLAPAGKTHLQVDIGCEVGDAMWQMNDEEVTKLCLKHLRPIVPDVEQRYLGSRVMRTPIAYPVFLRTYEAERVALTHATGVDGLYSIGRNGEFAHILMEDVYWRTLRRTRELIAARSSVF